jgi:peroxiredoxin
MRHLIVLLCAGFLCVVGAAAGGLFFMAGEMAHQVGVREIAGTDLDGSDMQLSDYRGKVVLLVFWSSDDPESPAVQAYLKRLQAKYDRSPFRILGVNGDASKTEAITTANNGRFGYRSFFDGPRQPIARAWYVTEYPTYFLIDHRGSEDQRYNLFLIADELEQDIGRLLREVPRK